MQETTSSPRSRFYVAVAAGERVLISGVPEVEIEVASKSGRFARLVITTGRDVRIERGEGEVRIGHAKHEMMAAHGD